MKSIAINLISIYQNYFSFDRGVMAIFAPGGACKYEVSCSEYTKQAIKDLGVLKGSWMGLKRIWGCR